MFLEIRREVIGDKFYQKLDGFEHDHSDSYLEYEWAYERDVVKIKGFNLWKGIDLVVTYYSVHIQTTETQIIPCKWNKEWAYELAIQAMGEIASCKLPLDFYIPIYTDFGDIEF